MTAISNLVAEPAWWFTAVFVGLVISIAAGFAQHWIAKLWGNYSATQRAKNERHKSGVEYDARLCVAEPTYFQANNATLTFLSAMTVVFCLVFISGFMCAAALTLYPTAILSPSAARIIITILAVIAFLALLILLTSFRYAFYRAEVVQRAEAIMNADRKSKQTTEGQPQQQPPQAPSA